MYTYTSIDVAYALSCFHNEGNGYIHGGIKYIYIYIYMNIHIYRCIYTHIHRCLTACSFTYIFCLVCIISIARFCREAATRKINGPISFNNIVVKAYFKEPTTAIFEKKVVPHDKFRVLQKYFSSEGVPLRPLGRPLAPSKA